MTISQPEGKFISETGLWILSVWWTVELTGGETLHVRGGFTSDGASIPPVLWPVVGPRFSPKTFPASLAHDAMYAAEAVSRSRADMEFRRLLQYTGVGYFKAYSYWLAVRAFGWLVWMRHRPGEVKRAKQFVEIIRRRPDASDTVDLLPAV